MPQKKRPKKTKVRKSKNKNLVLYVERCTLKGKIFKDSKTLYAWVKEYNKKYQDLYNSEDSWVDVIVTDIKSDIVSVEESLKID